MRKGYCSRFVCVCVCVYYRATCYRRCFYVSNAVLYGSLPRLDCMYYVDLAENTPFESSGVICRSPPLSLLLDELLMNKRDSNGFFSTRRVSMARDRFNKTTGSSLIVAHWQISFLAYCWHGNILACIELLYGTHDTGITQSRAICACVHYCGYFLHYWCSIIVDMQSA
jgi:hypothetical protein